MTTSPPSSQPENYLATSQDHDAVRKKRPRIDVGPVNSSPQKENRLVASSSAAANIKTRLAQPVSYDHDVKICINVDQDDDDDDDSSVEFLYERGGTAASLSMAAASIEASSLVDSKMTSVDLEQSVNDETDDVNVSSATDRQRPSPTLSSAASTRSPDVDCATMTAGETGDSASSPLPYQPRITPLTSAYLQNLAEICWTILFDQRWRIGPRQETLFQWEKGDDLSVVLALARRFIRPMDEDEDDDAAAAACVCLLCRDKVPPQPMDAKVAQATKLPKIFTVDAEEDDRCLHLYCRLFYRKGPWFRLDDLYKKYYTANNKPSASSVIDEAVMDGYFLSLQQLLDDLKRLQEKGFVRGFAGEEECAKRVDETLLSNAERGHVLLRLAAGSRRGRMVPCPPGTAIWKQMKSQRPLFPGTRLSYLPVRQHVISVMLQGLARMVLRCSHPQREPTLADVTHIEGRIRTMVEKAAVAKLMAGLCLRSGPHRTLARCARLYLCATHGPGNMRGDGTNGWRSLLEVPCPVPIAGILPPGIHAWHFADYPGLKSRFGLASYSFRRSFQFMPSTDTIDSAVQQVFDAHASFVAFECSIELRAHVDFALELENALRYNDRRIARGLQPLGNGQAQKAEDRHIDFLSLATRDGREKIVCKLLKTFHRLEKSLLDRIEDDIQMYGNAFTSSCHQILFATAIIAIHILCLRNGSVGNDELHARKSRPWLRHLWWDGNLSYVLWDLVPILEKVNHFLAVIALETLLFGERISSAAFTVIPVIGETRELAALLLSRRTRGKAFVRLFVDYRHLLKRARLPLKDMPMELQELGERQADSLRSFFDQAVTPAITTASIPFSAIRELAKPLKQPLSDLLREIVSHEVDELRLRLQNVSLEQRRDRYSEWNPTIDTVVANAIANDENGPGSRCAYVGLKDSDSPSSLNVEELAMEHYYMGRLPHGDPRGGWRGFHDEGSHVHTLFRIICAVPILGTSWGCGLARFLDPGKATYLSPYQGSPFDLLVGHEQRSAQMFSFYQSRRAIIVSLLDKLEELSKQALSDLIYDCVMARHTYMQRIAQRDPTSVDDTSRVRTLSLIAAGLGGKALASILRCLCFDYRHFRGGMPDLTLVRASIRDDNGESKTVDLGEFIGESFSVEYENEILARKAQMILGDEDFLGCSMGDAGGSNSFKRNKAWARDNSTASSPDNSYENTESIPDRLQLIHNHRAVEVEAMMVEVKSANDRLDPRQQDWLNVLDLHGNARVCKFEKSATKKKDIKLTTN